MAAMLRTLTLAVGLLAATPAVVGAQTVSETAAAREMFMQGFSAIQQGRWEDAERLLSQSYRLVPRASTLLNLATAQAELGRLVAARESYRRFLADPGTAAEQARPAREALAALEPRIAHLRIVAEGLEADDRVTLDGDALSRAAVGTRLPIDPGAHAVVVTRGDTAIGRASVSLEEGEVREVELTLRPLARVSVEDAPPEVVEGPGGDDLLASPWLWVAIGAGVLVAIAVTLGVVLGQPREPFVGNLGPGVVTF